MNSTVRSAHSFLPAKNSRHISGCSVSVTIKKADAKWLTIISEKNVKQVKSLLEKNGGFIVVLQKGMDSNFEWIVDCMFHVYENPVIHATNAVSVLISGNCQSAYSEERGECRNREYILRSDSAYSGKFTRILNQKKTFFSPEFYKTHDVGVEQYKFHCGPQPISSRILLDPHTAAFYIAKEANIESAMRVIVGNIVKQINVFLKRRRSELIATQHVERIAELVKLDIASCAVTTA
ncbi:MAG TPA: hypothetical protein PKA60_01795 [Candidatus Paceibacterota bacterium]|nr:hypothetical protein [Candidatus Paceibacterota bacterium]